MAWNESGSNVDIAISTRVRIARNVRGKAFPNRGNEATLQSVAVSVRDALLEGGSALAPHFRYIGIKDVDLMDREFLMEKHLISPALAMKNSAAGVIIDEKDELSIMLNEEDHIRIQCIKKGFRLEDAYDMANKADDLIEERIDYAFDDRYGYLTACPTNLGTGIRMSVMLHLPALTLTGGIDGVVKMAGKYGLTIRGIYGEGTEAMGEMYQISNQNSLGLTEMEILKNVKSVTKGVIKQERELRGKLLDRDEVSVRDRIMRAYGTLRYCVRISVKEAMQLISTMRLGIDMGIIEDVDIETASALMDSIQPAVLCKNTNSELNDSMLDVKRAGYIKKEIDSARMRIREGGDENGNIW